MRVSYIGNFSVPYSTESHIAKAWENLGHTVDRIPEQHLDWVTLDPAGDLLLWTRTAGFDPPDKQTQADALDRIKVPTVGYHLDRWWGLDRESWIDESPFFTSTDFLCTADGGHQDAWASKGITHYWFPPAILSDETALGVPQARYRLDVGFVGNLTEYGHKEWAPYRRDLYSFLRTRYGSRFGVFPRKGPAIRGRDLANLYATVKVLVGDSCLAGNATHYWSDRIPETLGRRGFLIHPEVEGLAEAHPHLMTYDLGDFDQLGVYIDAALLHANVRVENAMNNRQHVLDNHTYEHRMQSLLALL